MLGMDSPLITKSKEFALDIIKICDTVKKRKEGQRTDKSAFKKRYKHRCKYQRGFLRTQ